MIKITSLCKVYRSKKLKRCYALNGIDLTLPDAGLVFVLGKSGSGKSTLLNLIGGLDKITSGTIEVDGNDISNISERRMCNYRNSHVGFIFQDYHLIEELTVYDNILLSLNLRRMKDYGDVSQALARVGLAGYENRYPSELSGGERQRVAIARAIVKEPRIILADEPTGNLDPQTATSIIALLRELSKNHLILVVSHNTRDARAYADRIIELSNGRVVDDYTRKSGAVGGVHLSDGVLVYPEGRELNAEDIATINANASRQLVSSKSQFVATRVSPENPTFVEIAKEKLSFFKKMRLSRKFLKSKSFAIMLYSFMVAVIMVIMSLAQTIIGFDSGKIIAEEMEKSQQQSLLFSKVVDPEVQSRLDEKYHVPIDDGDIQAFYDAGYKGKIYPVLGVTLPITQYLNGAGVANTYFSAVLPYMKESLGTMIVDEAFLSAKFGEIKYLAVAEEQHPAGVIIPDYLADSTLMIRQDFKGKSYEDILGAYNNYGFSNKTMYVNAIIETGYRERHAALFDMIQNREFKSTAELYENDAFIAFSNDVYEKLGYCYSLNTNFEQDYEATLGTILPYRQMIVVNDIKELEPDSVNRKYFVKGQYLIDNTEKVPVPIGEIKMGYEDYNNLFGTNYEKEKLDGFVPHTVKLTQYRYYDIGRENPLFSMEFLISGLSTNATSIDDEFAKTMAANAVYYNALYFDGVEGIGTVLGLVEDLNYEHQSFTLEGIHTMTKAVDVFIPIFELIAIVLCVGVIFILFNFSSRMIKDKMHEIGILKALGTQNGTVGTVFGLQVVLIALLTCILSVAGYYYFIDLANDVLIESLKRLAPTHVVLDLNFLTFQKDIARNNCILVFILSLVALIPSMIKVKVIKPVKIIKTKD